MVTVEKSIIINAPADKIFAFWNDPQNLTDLWPSMLVVKNVRQLENGGTQFDFGFKMAGIKTQSTSKDTEVVPGEYVVNETTGGIKSTMRVDFIPETEGTKVTAKMNYTVSLPVLGRVIEGAARKANEKELETCLKNLKVKIET